MAGLTLRDQGAFLVAGTRRLLSLAVLNAEVVACRRCPRLVAWREQVARDKRAAFADETYWGRGVPSFGDAEAAILVVGLAPAAHGANRTGRMFTGDRSGDWLYRALYRAGLSNQAAGKSADDGLELRGVYITTAVRCAPPNNKPEPEERRSCRPYLEREMDELAMVKVIVALGGFAFSQVLRIHRDRGVDIVRPAPRFGHGVEVGLGEGTVLLGSYHPSQQNTFTGKLTERMFDSIWLRALKLSGEI